MGIYHRPCDHSSSHSKPNWLTFWYFGSIINTYTQKGTKMKELETKAAGGFAYAAAQDAQRQNSNNKSTYSQEQIRRALTVRDLLDSAFSYTNLYINYRKKFIAVKAEGARARDAMAKEVVDLFETNGYLVAQTPQGMIVRIVR